MKKVISSSSRMADSLDQLSSFSTQKSSIDIKMSQMNLGFKLEVARKECFEKMAELKLNKDWIAAANNGYKIIDTIG
jgi:hypothetical protein